MVNLDVSSASRTPFLVTSPGIAGSVPLAAQMPTCSRVVRARRRAIRRNSCNAERTIDSLVRAFRAGDLARRAVCVGAIDALVAEFKAQRMQWTAGHDREIDGPYIAHAGPAAPARAWT